MMTSIDYREGEVLALASKIVEGLRDDPSDIEIKVAALQTAASGLNSAVFARAQIAMIGNMINPRR